MTVQITDHLVCPLELLNQAHVLVLITETFPTHKTTPHRFEVVVLTQGDGKFLSTDEMAKQIVSLESQCVNRVAHPCQS